VKCRSQLAICAISLISRISRDHKTAACDCRVVTAALCYNRTDGHLFGKGGGRGNDIVTSKGNHNVLAHRFLMEADELLKLTDH